MKILIDNIETVLTDINKFGGEGDLYTVSFLGETKCVKIYSPEKRNSFNERKILSLINKCNSDTLGCIENFLGIPELPVFDINTRKFCGYMMKYFDNHNQISDYRFSNNSLSYGDSQLGDEDILNLFDRLFNYLIVLHNSGIILGDINPENILVDKNSLIPCLVDFDSVQFGSFFSNSNRQDYIDPTVKVDGYGNNKYFIYSIDSDVYSLATIFYETILGVKPHFFKTTVPTDTNYKKNIDLSFMDYFINNTTKTDKYSFNLVEDRHYDAFKARLVYIDEFYSIVIKYFISVFATGERNYFNYNSIIEGFSHFKRNILSSHITSIELVIQSKEDPDELELFMKQFDLKLI